MLSRVNHCFSCSLVDFIVYFLLLARLTEVSSVAFLQAHLDGVFLRRCVQHLARLTEVSSVVSSPAPFGWSFPCRCVRLPARLTVVSSVAFLQPHLGGVFFVAVCDFLPG